MAPSAFRRHLPLSTVFAGLAILLTLALTHATTVGDTVPGRVLSATDAASRLRVFGRDGDYKLTNDHVTAVVRRRDGWLVDLWWNRARVPTAPQLGVTTEIDALWQFHPVAQVGKDIAPLIAERVTATASGIETEAKVRVAGVELVARTLFMMNSVQPKVEITTRWTITTSQPPAAVLLGDAVRWGNVAYVVEGVAQPKPTFKGRARWIGRRGAGGDLVLRSTDRAPMRIDYKESDPGFAGTIHAFHAETRSAGEVTVARELSFEALPAPAATRQVSGRLRMTILDERGAPLPAKVLVRALTGKNPVFERDGALDGADSFLWTGNGQVERELPVGHYELVTTSGIERDLHRQQVVIRDSAEAAVTARLPRVIETPGHIAADVHLHQAPSVDADIDLPARVVSIAAEGVEFAVATDHYVLTDLAPTVRWLRERGVLVAPLQTMIGSEVSTLGDRFGHFNVFPLSPGSNIVNENTTPAALFADARQKSPQGVLQVNHPRWDPKVGYFTRFELDPKTAVPRVAGYSDAFDTIEVYNGLDAHDLREVERVLADWLRLLGRGYRYAATGSSDSHKLAFLDPGLPRTLIRHGEQRSDADDVAASPDRIVAAIKGGRSIVTSGPIIDATIAGAGPGERVSVAAAGSPLRLSVRVRAAPWIDVRELTVVEGGSGRVLHRKAIPATSQVRRAEESFELKVAAPTFVVVVVRGERPLLNASQTVRPFAFTNPIWLDL